MIINDISNCSWHNQSWAYLWQTKKQQLKKHFAIIIFLPSCRLSDKDVNKDDDDVCNLNCNLRALVWRKWDKGGIKVFFSRQANLL